MLLQLSTFAGGADDDDEPPRRSARIADRVWLRARLRDLDMTQIQLARLVGIRRETLAQSLGGFREWKADEVAAMARALGVDARELFARLGLALPVPTAPVVGDLVEGGRIERRPEGEAGAETIETPDLSDCLALRVATDYGPYERGTVILYRPADPASLAGRTCVIRLCDGTWLVRRLYRLGASDRWLALAWGDAATTLPTPVEIAEAGRIVRIIPE